MLNRMMQKLKNLKKKITRRHTEGQEKNAKDRKKILRKVRRGTIRAILEMLIFRFYREGKTIPESERGRQISL